METNEKGQFVKRELDKSLIGKRFGKLLVLDTIRDTRDRPLYVCRCDCGTEKNFDSWSLQSGHSKSCGCNRRRLNGLHSHTLYKTWNNITQRVGKHKNYLNISVFPDWYDFQKFYDWAISNGWKRGLTIDRIDSNGDYSPNNCRWVTMYVQARNKSTNRYVRIGDKNLCLTDWAKYLGTSTSTLYKIKIKNKLDYKDSILLYSKKHNILL